MDKNIFKCYTGTKLMMLFKVYFGMPFRIHRSEIFTLKTGPIDLRLKYI